MPVVLWLTLIFVGSTDLLSANHTSRLIGPFLRWLVPGISEAAVSRVQGLVRKTGHVTEYAVLSLLLWRARRQPVRGDARPWNWRETGGVILIAVLCAAGDEFHQSWVPSREGTVRDVLYDTVGATVGLGLLFRLGRWRRHW